MRDVLTFYKSGLRRQWRWRYQAAGNNKKLANGGEGYHNLMDAVHAAFRVCGLTDNDLDVKNHGPGIVRRAVGIDVEVRILY